LGSETDLQELSVHGGELSPVFDPTVRSYSVRLGLGYDQVRLVYRLRDNEQRIHSSAHPEHPTGKGGLPSKATTTHTTATNTTAKNTTATNTTATNTTTSAQRRLGIEASARRLGSLPERSGEAQFRNDIMNFMLDVGFTRSIELTVQCADATQASIGTYELKISRPGCTPERPYFDPEKRFCVNFCSSGYYRNRDTHRCSRCNTNCKVCGGLLDCHMCVPDTTDYSYVIQPNGQCQANANHLFKKYRLWCLALGVLLAFLLLVGCAGICHLCCAGGSGKGAGMRTYDSDSDEAPSFPAGRRLGMY